MEQNIGIIGLWHLGCVLSVSWSKLGHNVIGFDYDEKRTGDLNNGIPPIYEPNLVEEISKNIKSDKLKFTNKIKELNVCDFIFLSYDTPVLDDDSSDTTILEKSVSDVAKIMKDNSILIVSSQSPVGYCKKLRNILKSVNKTIDIAYSPENLRLGEAINCYLNPGRIILGVNDEETKKQCIGLFKEVTSDIILMSLESAEMVKHGINSFLSTSIVFVNHLADICESHKANIDDVIKGMKSDNRIGQKAYLSPGIGFSGGTLGRDLRVLEKANNNGYAKLFESIYKFNNERKYSIIKKFENILGDLKGKKIAILGVTYKPGTSTLRRSLPLEIVELLIQKDCELKVYDPKADYQELNYAPKFTICKSIEDAVKNSDMIVLMTEWNEFIEYDWSKVTDKMAHNYFFDLKNVFNKSKMQNSGMLYFSLGRTV
jgi:UDPglucose 6-dehydrogenase